MPVVPRLLSLCCVLGFATFAPVVGAAEGFAERPLAARSTPAGATMFTELSSAETGIVTENKYADPKMWWERFHEFEVGAIGTGVAIGDYDGDGRPDVFVVSKTEGNRLFRNLGNFRFEDVTARAGVGGPTDAWKQGATFADVNNDGRLDLYVCRFGAPNLLYVNRGDGTFREEAKARGLALVDASGMAAFCDYDRDGWLDVYVQTNLLDAEKHPDGQRDHLLHNNGDGTFSEVSDRAGITGETQGHSATWWDFDEDGWPDLYVANDFATPDSLYRNNRDGTFTNVLDRTMPHTPFSSMGADLGDVNNDGRIDFLVADMAATTHEKDQRGMAPARGRHRDDAKASAAAPQVLRNALYLNAGAGVCLEAANLAGLSATDWTWSVRFEDLDNDGRLDLHITNGMVRELHNDDLLSRMMAAESPAERIRVMRTSPVLAERNLAFRNAGDLRFEEIGAAWGLDQLGVSFGAAFGDLDGDGDLDLVFANYERGVTVLRNDCATGHRVTFALRGVSSNRFGVGATLRLENSSGVQVRQLVLARGYLSSSEPLLHFGLGDDARIARLTVSWPSGHVQTFTDLAADRAYTITEPAGVAKPAVAAPAAPTQFTEVTKETGLGLIAREATLDETVNQPLLPRRLNRCGPAIAVVATAGGGDDGFVLGGTPLDPVRWLRRANLNSRLPPFVGPAWKFPAQPLGTAPASGTSINDGPVLIFDADGDGANDVLVTKGGVASIAESPEYQPQLWLNRGAAGFVPAAADALPALPICVGATAAADFDRDGKLDVFLGGRVVPGEYPRVPRSALLANRGGRFVDVTAELAPGLQECGLVTAALWSDVDDDGWIDLLLACEWGGVRYWHNNSGRGFEDRSVASGFGSAGTGWWTALASADFNGDGRMDYVVGNVGLNTPYQASPERPALLFAGEWGAGGSTQLVEAYYEGVRLFPWRSRKQLGAAIPAIRKKYAKTDDFARATLGEMLGEERLAQGRKLAATELRSGVFLSQADGTRRFTPLPRLAQIAPAQGIVAGDFDGDGNADVFLVQNSFAPIASVGRFDGGVSQLLRGDGRGGFTPVGAAESGLIVPGDAKSVAVVCLNLLGRPDFLVTRNNAAMLAFQNGGRPGGHTFMVSLRGPAGNPSGVGARVTLVLSDRTKQTGEIGAGGGGLGQSTAACFFGWLGDLEPDRVRVRWPDGTVSTKQVSPNLSTVVVDAPAK